MANEIKFIDATDSSITYYDTFSALLTSETLAQNDIVSGEFNTFINEVWQPDGSGAEDHPIIISNATITKPGAIPIVGNGLSWITFSNLTVPAGGTETFGLLSSSTSETDGIIITDCDILSGSSWGINTNNVTGLVITNTDVANSGSHGYRLQNDDAVSAGGLTITNSSVSDSGGIGLQIIGDGASNTYNDITVNGFTSTDTDSEGVKLQNVDTGTISNLSISGAGSNSLSLNTATDVSFSNVSIIGGTNGINSTGSSGISFSGTVLNGSASGVVLSNDVNLIISDSTISGFSGGVGLMANDASTGLSVTDTTIRNNGIDGVNINDTTTATFTNVISCDNNSTAQSDYGDGFSNHDASTTNYYFCLAYGNSNSGHAHVGTSTGKICNNTLINNHLLGMERAEINIAATAAWEIKNTIVKNTTYTEDNTNGGWLIIAGAWSSISAASNNCYWSDRAKPFKVAGTAYTFAEYVAAGIVANGAGFEADSIFADPLITPSGKLYSNSPCIDTGVWIAGVNTSGETDIWGNQIDYPNIGADQNNFGSGGATGGVNIFISSDAATGENGSPTYPYDSFSDINWTTGGANSIYDWVDAGKDVYINLSGSVNGMLTVAGDGADGHPIRINLAGHTLSATGSDYVVYINNHDYITVQGPGVITSCNRFGIYTIVSNDITIKDLTVRDIGTAGTNNDGIRIVNDCADFLIDNVEVTFSTGLINSGIDIGSAVGEPVTGEIKNCLIHNISGSTYGQGIKFVADDKAVDIITVHGNIVSNVERYGVFLGGDGGKITLANNTLLNNGIPNGANIASDSNGTASGREQIIKNNILSGSPELHMILNFDNDVFTSDYNVFSTTAKNKTFRDTAEPLSYTFSEWSTETSQETNSFEVNPLTTPSGKLYHNSPCLASKNPGTAIAGVNGTGTTDRWGNAGRDGAIPIGAKFGKGVYKPVININGKNFMGDSACLIEKIDTNIK